jgi:hypothetical protein
MKTPTLILICLFAMSTYAQKEFTGSWFILRSESHNSEYLDTSELDSVSNTDTDVLDNLKIASSYSSTDLFYFLDIKKNGSFNIIGEKKINGKWKSHNDTIVLQLKKHQLYGYIKDNYLKLKVVKDTSAVNEFMVAIKLPNSNISNNSSFKGQAISYEPTSSSTFNFHFLNKKKVLLVHNKNQIKWSDIGTWNIIKYEDYKFLSIKPNSFQSFLFLLLNENDEEINAYEFSLQYANDKDFNENKIIKLKIDKKYSREINRKLIGKWSLVNSKPINNLNKNFKLKSFNLDIDKSTIKIQIETSEDLIYNLNYKYEMGEIPDYFILKNNKSIEPLSFVYDEANSKLILCYNIDSKERKYAYELKIELKKK